MIADSVVLIAMAYIDRGLKAEKKFQEIEAAQEVKQKNELNKAEHRANDEKRRSQQKHNKQNSGPNNAQKHHNIQQPSKRDWMLGIMICM